MVLFCKKRQTYYVLLHIATCKIKENENTLQNSEENVDQHDIVNELQI